MKILLIQPMSFLYTLSGAAKANRMLLEELVRKGHECRVLCLESEKRGQNDFELMASVMNTNANTVFETSNDEECWFTFNGIQVHAVHDDYTGLRYCQELVVEINAFCPDWVLLSEDRSYVPLATALDVAPDQVVFLCHSQTFLPFGPESFCETSDHSKTALLKKAAGIVTVSSYVKKYIYQWADLESTVIRFPVYGSGPFANHGWFDDGYILMINPSSIKGIDIFVGLARHFPTFEFAAVPSWATSVSDMSLLKSMKNITLLKPVHDISQLFQRARVVVVPSLWGEAFGQIVIESMLHGIPVLASNAGALPEAKLGVDYVIPINRIQEYRESTSKASLPIPVVPHQDIVPWQEALSTLLSDRETYNRNSRESYAAAVSFVSSINPTSIIDYLHSLKSSISLRPRVGGNPSLARLRNQIRKLPPDQIDYLKLRK